MNILISGGTGFIGKYLVKALTERGDSVTIISRNAPKETRKPDENVAKFIRWSDDLVEAISESDAVINLAGNNLFDNRWNVRIKREIVDSRITSTSKLANAINLAEKKPKVFISGSAVGFYGDRSDEVLTEESPPGEEFLAQVCIKWEEASKEAQNTRVVNPRIGIVKQIDDGALQKMLLPFKLFIGGPLGSGNQYYPWIHMDDVVGLLLFALDNRNVEGPLNVVSPNPVKMKEFASALGKVMHRPSLFPVPKFALKMVVGEASEAILASHNVIPDKALKLGYKFKFPGLNEALSDILT